MAGERNSTAERAFARQAKAFARSPLHRDKERLRRLMAFVEPRSGDRALDVACGPGIVTAALEQHGLFATGVDLAQEMITEALAGGQGRYARGDAARLPFLDGVFDVAVCRNTFHHLADPSSVLEEMMRVIRPGGRVVVEDLLAPEDPAKREYQETIERLRDVAHVRALARDEFRALTARAGLTDYRDEPVEYVIDCEEWIDRAFPSAANRARVFEMIETCLEEDRAGLKVWRDGNRLKFERRSLLWRARTEESPTRT
jgi:ubiquinone/menaquinone biosynthesis C-methylase UbiE